MRTYYQIVNALIIILLFAGCTSHMTWSRHEICFGLSADSGHTVFSDQQWQEFINQEIVHRFPDGFTVYKADGYWRTDEETVTEPSRILMVVAPDNQETQNKLNAIAEAYIRKFRQKSVLHIKSPSNVEFHD